MPLKTYKPTTPSRRGTVSITFEDLTTSRPEKSLVAPLKRSGGRNSRGKMTARRRGGGAKRAYRIIDFKRDKFGVPGKVATIEYDPNRSARIALIHYVDGDKRYIIHPETLKIGDFIESGPDAEIRTGNALPLSHIPQGTQIHNIEMQPGRGAKIVRSAGLSAQLQAKEGMYVLIRLPSGEVRWILSRCMATVGEVGNSDNKNVKLGKAGKSRHLGRRPSVRGSAMTPRDHPHGGGEGRSPIGMKGPKTPWGKPALGYRTRRNKRTDNMIDRRRGKKR